MKEIILVSLVALLAIVSAPACSALVNAVVQHEAESTDVFNDQFNANLIEEVKRQRAENAND
jgi:hypothetical protein